MNDIIIAVTKAYEITPEQLQSKSRKKPLPEARRMLGLFLLAKDYDIEDITRVTRRSRTWTYRSINKIRDEILLYKDVEIKHQVINKTITNTHNHEYIN